MIAVKKAHEAVVRLLVDAGAELDTTDLHGWTALGAAQEQGHARIVRLLQLATQRSRRRPPAPTRSAPTHPSAAEVAAADEAMAALLAEEEAAQASRERKGKGKQKQAPAAQAAAATDSKGKAPHPSFLSFLFW